MSTIPGIVNYVWSQLTEQVILQYLEDAKDNLVKHNNHILSLDLESITFDKFYYGPEDHDIAEPSANTKQTIMHYAAYIHTDPLVRKASNDSSSEFSRFYTEQQSSELVLKRLALVNKLLDAGGLEQYQVKYLTDIQTGIMNSGVNSPHYERIQELESMISTIGYQFAANISNDDTHMYLSRQDLDGLPEEYFEDREQDSNGHYLVTTRYPDVIPVLTLCNDRSTRYIVGHMFVSRCQDANVPLMQEAVKLREELAHLLGYNTYLDYSTSDKMAKNAQSVVDFVSELSSNITSKCFVEVMTLQRELNKDYPDVELGRCDVSYYINKRKQQVLNLDMQHIKELLETEHVYRTMFSFYENLLGIRFNRLHEGFNSKNLWHESIQMYNIVDRKTDQVLGYFYLDNYPRPGKYTHACMCSWEAPSYWNNVRTPGVCTMICNFDPSGTLSFDEVNTLFHEFGHMMHVILGDNVIGAQSSFHVEHDFVECPSQLMEYFLSRPDMLRALSQNKLTDEEITALAREDNFYNALAYMQQMSYCTIDNTLHMNKSGTYDINTIASKITQHLTYVEQYSGANMLGSFSHIINGYAGGYYGYSWSRVYAYDIYSTLFDNKYGSELEQAGEHLRNVLYKNASTKPATDIMRELLGREPNTRAFSEYLMRSQS